MHTLFSEERYTKFWIYTSSFSGCIGDGALVFFGGGKTGTRRHMGCVLVEGTSPRGLSKILRTHSHLLRTNCYIPTRAAERRGQIRLAQLHPHSAVGAHRLGVFSGADGACRKIAIRKSRVTRWTSAISLFCTGPTASISKSAPPLPSTRRCRERSRRPRRSNPSNLYSVPRGTLSILSDKYTYVR